MRDQDYAEESIRAQAAEDHSRAQQTLIDRLRRDAGAQDSALTLVREQLAAAEDELVDLRAVRDALTPAELPERPGLSLSVSFQPARRRVSGDFYLAVPGADEATVIVVGDVVGKGIEAARDAAFLRTVFATSAQFSTDPCQLMAWANLAYAERRTPTVRFATVVCTTFLPETRTLRVALAGHPAPMWLGTGEEVASAQRTVPLGIDATLTCRAEAIHLGTDDGILLYTDGLTEARSGVELFGTGRVATHLRTHRKRNSADVLTTLQTAASDFSGGTLTDDLCLLSVCARAD